MQAVFTIEEVLHELLINGWLGREEGELGRGFRGNGGYTGVVGIVHYLEFYGATG